MSTLTYNGVSLPYTKTKGIRRENVFSQENADYLYTRVTLSVDTLIHAVPSTGGSASAGSFGVGTVAAQQANNFPALPGESATAAMRRLQHLLEQPRRELVFTVNGVVLLEVKPGKDGKLPDDVKNGPIPKVLSIDRIDGDTAFRVSFQVECHVRECPGGKPPSYLSHRWTEEVVIDDNFISTKTRTGRIITRTGINADSLRGTVCPPIEPEFRRLSSKYHLTEDGLSLQYTFVDREVFKQPPEPTIKASLEWFETSETGALRHGEAVCTLTGHKGTPKSILVQLAFSLVYQRLQKAGIQEDNGQASTRSSIHEHDVYGENAFTFRMRAMLKPIVAITADKKEAVDTFWSGFVDGLTNPFGIFGSEPTGQFVASQPTAQFVPKEVADAMLRTAGLNLAQYDDSDYLNGKTPPDPGTRATAGLRLIAAALNDPCLEATANSMALANGDQATPEGTTNSLSSGGTGGSDQPVAITNGARSLSSIPKGPTANVREASIEIVKTLPNPVSSSGRFVSGGVYTDYQISARYKRNHRVSMMPATKKPTPGTDSVAFTKLSAPTLVLLLEWTATRVGEPPKVPDPTAFDLAGNAVLIDEEFKPGSPELAPDGSTFIYTASGSYTYGFRRPEEVNIAAPVLPWVRDLVASGETGALGSLAQAAIDAAKKGIGVMDKSITASIDTNKTTDTGGQA